MVTLSGGLVVLGKPLKSKLFLGKEIPEYEHPFKQGVECKANISDKTYCYYVDNGSNKTLWVLGDSHAEALYMASESIANSRKFNLELYTAGGTPFPPVGHYRKSEKQSDLQKLDDFRVIEKRLRRRLSPGDVILLSMRLPYHFGGTYYEYPSSDFVFPREDGSPGSQEDYFKDWTHSVKDLASLAKDRNARLIIQTPTPEWEREKTKQCNSTHKQWFNSLSNRDCSLKSDFFNNPKTGLYANLLNNLYRLANSNENIHLLDTYSIVCPGDTCQFNDGRDDIYIDDDHLHYQWAKNFIAPRINELIEE